MAVNEPFSWKKFFDISPLAWAKVAGIAVKVGIAIMVIIVMTMIGKFLLPAKSDNINQPSIEAQAGSNVVYNVSQNKEKSGWSADVFGGGLKFPDKDDMGYFVGGKIGYEF